MAILHSKMATGAQEPPVAFTKGLVSSYITTFVLATGAVLDTTDILELGVLPAGHSIVDVRLATGGTLAASTKVSLGIMTGEVGSNGTRTCGTEIMASTTAAAFMTLAKASGLLVAPAEVNRSIGLVVDVKNTGASAGSEQTFTLQVQYAQ